MLNAGGTLLGALVALLLERLGALARWSAFRTHWLGEDGGGAMVLLALWPWALLFPAAVPFGLGQVLERLEQGLLDLLEGTPFLMWLPLRESALTPLSPVTEMLCVMLGLWVPCLLAYCVMRHMGRRAVLAGSAIVIGIAVSAMSAALSWGLPMPGSGWTCRCAWAYGAAWAWPWWPCRRRAAPVQPC